MTSRGGMCKRLYSTPMAVALDHNPSLSNWPQFYLLALLPHLVLNVTGGGSYKTINWDILFQNCYTSEICISIIYGCEIRYLAPREYHGLRVFDIRVMRGMSGSDKRKKWCQFQIQAALPRWSISRRPGKRSDLEEKLLPLPGTEPSSQLVA
jgi:hypothetical protein